MNILKKVLLVLLVVLVIAQFFGPERNEGSLQSVEPFLAETKPNDQVATILKETCFDCHSDFTRYPWYDKITPVNYWLNDHVEEGKEHLNFSDWSNYSTKKKDHKMEEVAEEVEEGEMPLKSYTYTHADANLSDEQIQAVVDWVNEVRRGYGVQ